jgi:hypothetical protein
MILSGGVIINVQTNKYTSINNNPFLERDLDDTSYEGQIYDPIADQSWGVNGYCQLRFSKSIQTSESIKSRIELLSQIGTVAFWNNPLKDENHRAHEDNDLDTLESFYPPKVKDTDFSYLHNARDLTDISGEGKGSIGASGSGTSQGFQLFSTGDNGEVREIILHNSRDIDAEQTNSMQANMLITKTGNVNSPISRSASDIKWTSGSYTDSMEVNSSLITNLGTAGIFSESPTQVSINGSGSSNYPRITDNYSITGSDEIILKVVDKNVSTGSEYNISLQKYIASGDTIYLSSAGKKYRVLNISYNGDVNTGGDYGKTTIKIDADINGSYSDHSIIKTGVDSNDIVDTVSLTCGAIHFKDGGTSTVASDLFISGGYTGDLKVLQFNNSSTFADQVNIPSEYGTGGGCFIETKDFDFGNPSSLKNINYIDISAKGVGQLNVYYSVDNSGNFITDLTDPNALNSDIQLDPEFINTFRTFRFKKNHGSIKNCKSIQLRIEVIDGEGFELNDISIVYREKNL